MFLIIFICFAFLVLQRGVSVLEFGEKWDGVQDRYKIATFGMGNNGLGI